MGNWKSIVGVLLVLAIGFGLGLGYRAGVSPVFAMVDRHDDTILCTGTVAIAPGARTDGIWLLDYKSGRLLGTVIDRNSGKVANWAEVDLVNEFGTQGRNNVHFMMVTGSIGQGQAALYIAETVSGKFGVYTMGPRQDGEVGITIRRHDQTTFRNQAP